MEEMPQYLVRHGKGSPGPQSTDPAENEVTTPLPWASRLSLAQSHISCKLSVLILELYAV